MIATVFLMCFSTTSNAIPVIIDFTGTVQEIRLNNVEVSSAAGINLMDPVWYSILLDTDRVGTNMVWDTTLNAYVTQEIKVGTPPDPVIEFDYVELISGYLLADDSIYEHVEHPIINHFAYPTITQTMFMGSENHGLVNFSIDGVNWVSDEFAYISENEFVNLRSSLTIEKVSTVPEPASIMLLGVSFIWLLSLRFRFRRK
jgi:hypothetical protein